MGDCCSHISKKYETIEGLIKLDDIRTLFGEFHLLGDGGSSNVFSVRNRKNAMKYSLKKMSKRQELTLMLFESEASILRQLKHPNIIRLVDIYVDAKSYYIVTDLCKGGDLLNHIKLQYGGAGKAKFKESYAAKIINQIVDAVSYCHAKNIVHRDIKPENFVFVSNKLNSKLVLIDFGIAKTIEDDATYSDLVGTPYYMAPEYLIQTSRTGLEIKAADIWSIGIVAFVLCTGRPPFYGNTNEEVFIKIISKQLKFPRKSRLSLQAKTFLKHCLQKCVDKRPTAPQVKKNVWLRGGAADQELDVVNSLISFDLRQRARKVIKRVVKTHHIIENGEDSMNLRAIFAGIDADGDGRIDDEELQNFLLKQGYAKCQVVEQAKKIMKQLDTDGDGILDVKEFEEAWVQFQLSSDEKLVSALFNVFDEDGNGRIDCKEMVSLIGDSEESEKIFRLFDKDGDNGVDLEEFGLVLETIGFLTKAKDNQGGFLFTENSDEIYSDSQLPDTCIDSSVQNILQEAAMKLED